MVIARDKTKRQQHQLTVFNEQERLHLIQNLKIVDNAVLGKVGDHFKIIRALKPTVLVLGYDQEVREKDIQQQLARYNLHPLIKRAKPYKQNRYKSSLLKRKAAEKNKIWSDLL